MIDHKPCGKKLCYISYDSLFSYKLRIRKRRSDWSKKEKQPGQEEQGKAALSKIYEFSEKFQTAYTPPFFREKIF